MPSQALSLPKALGLLGDYLDEVLAVAALAPQWEQATDLRAKVQVAVKAVKIFSGATPTELDDKLVDFVQALLSSSEVVSSFKALVAEIAKMKSPEKIDAGVTTTIGSGGDPFKFPQFFVSQ